jgi:hypothetical protein
MPQSTLHRSLCRMASSSPFLQQMGISLPSMCDCSQNWLLPCDHLCPAEGYFAPFFVACCTARSSTYDVNTPPGGGTLASRHASKLISVWNILVTQLLRNPLTPPISKNHRVFNVGNPVFEGLLPFVPVFFPQ